MTLQSQDRSPTFLESGKYFQTNGNWESWTIPNTCNLIYIMSVGAGGGGGGGGCQVNGTLAGGGGGGAAGGLIQTIIPALMLPKTLYINTGLGGSGGLGEVSGGALSQVGGKGGDSYVCVYPDTLLGNIICRSLGGSGGGGGGANSSGIYGNCSTVGWETSATFAAHLGLSQGNRGRAGAVGGANGQGGVNSFGRCSYGLYHQYAAGGAGGAGTPLNDPASPADQNYAGGYSLMSNYTYHPYPIRGGVVTSSVNAGNGRGFDGYGNAPLYNNFEVWNSILGGQGPFLSSGGAGGCIGWNASTSANDGGRGGYGSGGGGGGGSRAPKRTTGGNGGQGGDGYVFIQCL